MFTSNIKDTVTTICGILFVIGGAIASVATAGIALPAWLVSGSIVVATVSASIVAFLTGKNPNGTTKSEAQVVTQNAQQVTLAKPVVVTQPAVTVVTPVETPKP